MPRSLIDSVLTVTVMDPYTYAMLTHGQSHHVDYAAKAVVGNEVQVRVELVDREAEAG